MARRGTNYRKRTIKTFKSICSSGKYKFEVELKGSIIHEEIKDRYRIGDDKIKKYLHDFIIRENDDVTYKNPNVWRIFSDIPDFFNPSNITPPTSIDSNEDLQREYGSTMTEALKNIEKRYGKKIPENVLLSWIGKYPNIKKGIDGIFYVSP